MSGAPEIYQLKVRLLGISPMIWRRVLVPASTTLRELHGDDETGLRHTMVTTEANDLVRPIHAKGRMPVILEPEDYETWLTGPIEKARALLRPFSSEKKRIIKHGFDEKQDLPPGFGGAFA